ncbi:hypothetical protein C2857_001321 [Epichloe festucae Fl1]|uniref:Transcriptional regulator n=1 Tax=Epichloe festucae (strain Fl1) TaxID=877507 RepID=A0A7S9KJP4_EPIFF|nr:hypothetical protein C2857_001321 [Epichloe festucae Fl1]
MVPSPKELEAALIDGTYQIFTSEPDATTVNKVRKRVEEEKGLDEGFFTSEEWKQKSKTLIKEYVEKLLDGWVPGPKDDSGSKNGTKRLASEDGSSSPKRQKHRNGGAKSKGRADDATETKARTTKTASRRKSKEAGSNRDREPDVKKMDSPPEGSEGSEDDDALSSSIKVGTSQTPAQQEEEEYSDVIDEGSKPERKKKEPKYASSKSSKLAAKKATAPSTDDPQEAEIKKLQSQLVKCGVRKLWHNELKQYGDDSRAKIRHLKKMLTDIGMDGRFSEAKAREIKETRELLADVDAAKEMNALWGMNSGRRASRSKNKSTKLEDSEEDSKDSDVEGGAAEIGGHEEEKEKEGEGEGEGEDDQETTSFAARRRRAQADLAFLGDDSESD